MALPTLGSEGGGVERLKLKLVEGPRMSAQQVNSVRPAPKYDDDVLSSLNDKIGMLTRSLENLNYTLYNNMDTGIGNQSSPSSRGRYSAPLFSNGLDTGRLLFKMTGMKALVDYTTQELDKIRHRARSQFNDAFSEQFRRLNPRREDGGSGSLSDLIGSGFGAIGGIAGAVAGAGAGALAGGGRRLLRSRLGRLGLLGSLAYGLYDAVSGPEEGGAAAGTGADASPMSSPIFPQGSMSKLDIPDAMPLDEKTDVDDLVTRLSAAQSFAAPDPIGQPPNSTTPNSGPSVLDRARTQGAPPSAANDNLGRASGAATGLGRILGILGRGLGIGGAIGIGAGAITSAEDPEIRRLNREHMRQRLRDRGRGFYEQNYPELEHTVTPEVPNTPPPVANPQPQETPRVPGPPVVPVPAPVTPAPPPAPIVVPPPPTPAPVVPPPAPSVVPPPAPSAPPAAASPPRQIDPGRTQPREPEAPRPEIPVTPPPLPPGSIGGPPRAVTPMGPRVEIPYEAPRSGSGLPPVMGRSNVTPGINIPQAPQTPYSPTKRSATYPSRIF